MAWELKEMGYSLSEIAHHLGLESPASVTNILKAQYEQDAAYLGEEARGTLLAIQFGRLERIIRGSMQSAELGDPKSADVVLKAMEMENKLTKQYADDAGKDQSRVLVVGGLEVDYVETLKELSA